MKLVHAQHFQSPDLSAYDWQDELWRLQCLERDCEHLKMRLPGLNREGEPCIRAYRAQFFQEVGLQYEPIIMNLKKRTILVDFKALNINKREAFYWENKFKFFSKHDKRKAICFIVWTGYSFQEFIFFPQQPYLNFWPELEQIFKQFPT